MSIYYQDYSKFHDQYNLIYVDDYDELLDSCFKNNIINRAMFTNNKQASNNNNNITDKYDNSVYLNYMAHVDVFFILIYVKNNLEKGMRLISTIM